MKNPINISQTLTIVLAASLTLSFQCYAEDAEGLSESTSDALALMQKAMEAGEEQPVPPVIGRVTEFNIDERWIILGDNQYDLGVGVRVFSPDGGIRAASSVVPGTKVALWLDRAPSGGASINRVIVLGQ